MSPRLAVIPPGRIPFAMLQSLHALVAVVMAIRLASQTLDDKPSGTLGFLKIAHLPPRVWVSYRCLAMLIGYAPVWVLRIPVYALVLSLGGVQLDEVLWLEAVQFVAFFTAGSLSLLVARYAATPLTLAVAVVFLLSFAQFLFFVPIVACAIIAVLSGRTFSFGDVPWAATATMLSIPRYFGRMPQVTEEAWAAGVSMLLHLIAAGVLLRLLGRVLYVDVGTEMVLDEPAGPKSVRRTNSRPSRRCWDDALAWQASHVHCVHSSRARNASAIVGAGVVLLLCLVLFKEPRAISVVIGVSGGMTLAILAFKSADCFTRELKAGTLATLSLVPLDGGEIYAGWARGARHIARPAYFAIALGFIAMTLATPTGAPYWGIAFAFAVLVLPEVAFVSNVLARKTAFLTFDLVQLGETAWRLLLAALVFAVTLAVGAIGNAWAALAVFVMLCLAIRRLMIFNLPRLFARRVQSEQ